MTLHKKLCFTYESILLSLLTKLDPLGRPKLPPRLPLPLAGLAAAAAAVPTDVVEAPAVDAAIIDAMAADMT